MGGLTPGMLVLASSGQEGAAGLSQPGQVRALRWANKPAFGGVSWGIGSQTGAQEWPGAGRPSRPPQVLLLLVGEVCVQVWARSCMGCMHW